MNHFDVPANVEAYASLTADAVDEHVLEVFRSRVRAGAKVLEIGSGPGHDIAHLRSDFDVVASDKSAAFIDYIRRTQPEVPTHVLDARTLDIDQPFDAIFSNKVLQYLDDRELAASFERQRALLQPGGVAVHTLWHGQGTEKELELCTYRRNLQQLAPLLDDAWAHIEHGLYTEHDTDDSLWIVLEKKAS